jgi:hypothetical protein
MKRKISYVLIGMVLVMALVVLVGAGDRRVVGRYAVSTTAVVDEPMENILLAITVLDTYTGAFRVSTFGQKAIEGLNNYTVPYTTGSSKYFTWPHNAQAPHRSTSQLQQAGVEYFVDIPERSSAFRLGFLVASCRPRSL